MFSTVPGAWRNGHIFSDFCENLKTIETPMLYICEHISKEFTGKNEYRGDPIKQFLNEIENQNSLMKERSVYEILKNTISCFGLDNLKLGEKYIDLDESDDETILEIILETKRILSNFLAERNSETFLE